MKARKERKYLVSLKSNGKFMFISKLFPTLMDRIHLEQATLLLGKELTPGLYELKIKRIPFTFKYAYHYRKLL